jgi:hypothetical protein
MENEFKLKKNNDLFGKNIVNEILITIILFLSCEYACIAKRVCKIWFNILKSDLSKKTLTQIPKEMNYSELYRLDFVPLTFFGIGKYIYI